MTPYRRITDILSGKSTDRIPIVFWRHFRPGGKGYVLAQETVEFSVKKFRLDIIKIMPDIEYPIHKHSVDNISDLDERLILLSAKSAYYREHIQCIRRIRLLAGKSYPLVLTVFSPLTSILRLLKKNTGVSLVRDNPQKTVKYLEIMTQNISRLARDALGAGADGIFFSCMGGTSAGITRNEYFKIGMPYDLEVLHQASKGWLNILHMHTDPDQCGDMIYTDIFLEYPVPVISWSDRLNGPGIREMRSLTDKILMGGLSERGPLVFGDEKAIEREINDAVFQSHGKKLILACGCSLPEDTGENHLKYARDYVEKSV